MATHMSTDRIAYPSSSHWLSDFHPITSGTWIAFIACASIDRADPNRPEPPRTNLVPREVDEDAAYAAERADEAGVVGGALVRGPRDDGCEVELLGLGDGHGLKGEGLAMLGKEGAGGGKGGLDAVEVVYDFGEDGQEGGRAGELVQEAFAVSKGMKKSPALSSSALMRPTETRAETSVVGQMAQLT